MTERFMVDDCGTLIDMTNRNTYDYVSDVCELLNEQHETIQRLKGNIDELLSVDIEKELLEENEQLKKRNQRQAKRLAELYELMAKKDWESLTEIIDDFCSCEEQLQRESGTYGDLE